MNEIEELERLWSHPGPGADLPAYKGPERRNLKPMQRAMRMKALLDLVVGILLGVAIEALWLGWRH